uniref:Uncharacterized protein n=1 Tax=Setaria italica TaxID=4555 RepID=K3Z1D5_SETIT
MWWSPNCSASRRNSTPRWCYPRPRAARRAAPWPRAAPSQSCLASSPSMQAGGLARAASILGLGRGGAQD